MQRYQLKLSVPPVVEPISLTTARDHCRLDEDITEDDVLIAGAITAARILAETALHQKLITQDWAIALDYFPGCLASSSSASYLQAYTIPLVPVQQVLSLKYYDENNVLITMDSMSYQSDAFGLRTRLMPLYGQMWPATAKRLGAVQIAVRVGFGDDETQVPENIRQWMLCAIADMYEHRTITRERGDLTINPFIDGLLDSHRVVSI